MDDDDDDDDDADGDDAKSRMKCKFGNIKSVSGGIKRGHDQRRIWGELEGWVEKKQVVGLISSQAACFH